VDFDGLVGQEFITRIIETFIVARAGVRRAIMLGAPNAHKQGKKKDQDIGSSAKSEDEVQNVVSVNDG